MPQTVPVIVHHRCVLADTLLTSNKFFSSKNHPRFPSPQESYRLEHCDDKHMAWYRAIGNAVSVPMISAVAQALLDALELLPWAVPSMAGAGCTLWL